MEQVSWYGGVEWCDANGLRLPSETEWEFACRAGTTTRFSFGNRDEDLGRYGWYEGNSGLETHSVGEKKPNAFGLFDMHGNVWEWCQDTYYRSYRGAPTDGSAWEDADATERVFRGGSWNVSVLFCRSAVRYGFPPGVLGSSLGFRPAINLPSK